MKRIYMILGRLYPRGYRSSISKLLEYSGSTTDALTWLGGNLFINLILILVIVSLWLVFATLSLFTVLIVSIASLLVMQIASYMIPYYSADRRSKAIEAVLPSFYQLMASYLRSGMTPFQALKSSSKKEFGTLKEELDIATSKALGTQSFGDALLDISNRVKSENLTRSTELMVRGMESGGSLARLLEESATNLVENKSLKKQIISASRTYALMVIFAVLIGAPLLLSISTRFNERLIGLTTTIAGTTTEVQELQLGIITGTGTIDPNFLNNAALFTIIMTSLISSFLVGIIQEGKEKYGIKYAVFLVPLSIGFFYLFRYVLTMFF